LHNLCHYASDKKREIIKTGLLGAGAVAEWPSEGHRSVALVTITYTLV